MINSAGLNYRRRAAHAGKTRPPSQAEMRQKLRDDVVKLQETIVTYRCALQGIVAVTETHAEIAAWQMRRLAKAALRGPEPAKDEDIPI